MAYIWFDDEPPTPERIADVDEIKFYQDVWDSLAPEVKQMVIASEFTKRCPDCYSDNHEQDEKVAASISSTSLRCCLDCGMTFNLRRAPELRELLPQPAPILTCADITEDEWGR